MLTGKRERHLVMDLESAASSSAVSSRKSSSSLSERVPSTSNIDAQLRRSSASQLSSYSSTSIAAHATAKRLPLAPLDPQLTSSAHPQRMPHDDPQSGRKPSITLTNATRPTPYTQRNIPRRSTHGQSRRTSLPAINLPPESPPSTSSASTYDSTSSIPHDEDIYSQLSTFTFGDAHPTQPSSQSSALSSPYFPPKDIVDPVAPFNRSGSIDRTPRPSLAPRSMVVTNTHARAGIGGWSSPSEDEEELRRVTSRGKMRAIDDGTRRPSLPTNGPHQNDRAGSSTTPNAPLPSVNDKSKVVSATASPRSQGQVSISNPSDPLSAHFTPAEDGNQRNLDTNIDRMEVDNLPDRRRQRRRRAQTIAASDHSSSQIDGQFTSDFGSVDDDDGMPDDEVHMVDEDDHDSATRTWVETSGRRGSLPMNIPNSTQRISRQPGYSSLAAIAPFSFDAADVGVSSNTDYEMQALSHAQSRRPSRSLDDDFRSSAMHLHHKSSSKSIPGASRTIPSSEPDLRGAVVLADAIAIAQAHAHQGGSTFDLEMTPTNEPYAGLDLNYIFGAGMTPSGSQTSIYDGRGGVNGMRMSIGSIANSREREGSWTAGWGIASNGGRRPSTATVDDPFLRFVKKNDFSYDERRREWCFAREKIDTDQYPVSNSQSSGYRYGQEMWRCLWVGRYKIERSRAKAAETDPTKPPSVRLNVKHVIDPLSKGNPNGGPSTFIHKHSRAQAFSIFRGHSLPQRHLKTSSSILLAPKKVQEQYTSTRTTSKLSTHGLLDDRQGKPKNASGVNHSSTNASSSTVASSSSVGVSTSSKATSESLSSRDNLKSKELSVEPDRKGKGVVRDRVVSENAEASTSKIDNQRNPSTSSPLKDDEARSPPISDLSRRLRELPSRPASSLDTQSLASEGSHVFSSSLSAWDENSIHSSNRDSLRSVPAAGLRQQLGRASTVAKAKGSVGSLDDQPMSRSSHAEAFATLDPPFLQHLRLQAAHYDGSGDQDATAPSRFRGLKKLFQGSGGGGPPLKNAPKHASLPTGPHAAVLDGKYTPPWLTMAARSKQEEQERVIKNLNDSFRDVGLLPSFKPGKNRPKGKGRRGSENVFDQIPDDALYMLVPLWPGETDRASTVYGEDPSFHEPPLTERQYLLVYYVPMLSKDQRKDSQKRSRSSQTSSANSHSDSSTTKDSKVTISLSAFNIMARLVSYKDVNGSGIRIPTIGLSVTGSMVDAVRAIPVVRFEMDDLALIIGFCDKQERGVEILPEGAEKLGLCLPRESPDMDLDAPLSSLGRAAVEMAWLGALTVMGYCNP